MNAKVKIPWWYWPVAAISLLWNINALLNLVLKECQWNNALSGKYAGLVLAVLAGLLASMLLLMRKSLAYKASIISFVAMLLQAGYWFFEYGN